jgi:hypothetical protein
MTRIEHHGSRVLAAIIVVSYICPMKTHHS